MKNKRLVTVFIVLLVAIAAGVGIFTIISKNTGATPKSLIKKAEILDWEKVNKEISKNEARAEDYENKWYIFCGKVKQINATECKVETIKKAKNSSTAILSVKLEKEVLKELKMGDTITVVGNLHNATTFPTLVDAIQLNDEIIKENLVVAVASKKGYFDEYFYDYQYDSSVGKITKYTKNGGTGEGKYTLVYDAEGNLVQEIREPFSSSLYATDVTTYTYNKDGTIATETVTEVKDKKEKIGAVRNYSYEKDSEGRIKKQTMINITGDNYKLVYEYKYEGDKVVEEKQTSPHSIYKINYEYDQFGNIIKERSYNVKKPSSVTTTTYIYDVVAKK